MELAGILRREKERPGFQIRDAVKLLYQSEFGGGHLISDPQAAYGRLCREMETCESVDEPLVTEIGNGFCRVNLSPARKRFSPETLFRIFRLSARERHGDLESFKEKLKLVYELGFDRTDADRFLSEYVSSSCPMLSHSESYRAANKPAYRVILTDYARYFDVFSAVDRLEGRILVGVDGMCAAGKSALARALADVYDAELYHADDYFLPAELRTPARLSEPGGNMHRERLLEEVLLPITRGEKPVTRRFDCGRMGLEPPVEHELRRVNIVEGSYCLHPELRNCYTLKIALRTAPETQLTRLRERDPERLDDFLTRWIPMENTYFAATGLFEAADVVMET